MSACLLSFNQTQLDALLHPRPGETRLGETVGLLSSETSLENAYQQGFKFVLVGIPEDIGPRANLGKGGADKGWLAFLSYFLNLQSNTFLGGNDILLLGQICCDDLDGENIESLRLACEELDQRVTEVLKQCFAASLIPIVIGGGHNNALPIIKACQQIAQHPLAVANLDPHADFRQPEGRHSGNPFRYAYDAGWLKRYTVLGLHEQKNSLSALNALRHAAFPFYSIQRWKWRQEIHLDEILEKTAEYLTAENLPVGLELDLDAIADMPSSAVTHCGVSSTDALHYIDRLASLDNVRYLHLAEGAPERHPAGMTAGNQIVGQMLTELVCTFIKARER
ncbi:formimidoylglutamase [Neptunicella sp. SCSIO 80796]|uniref:formimidoylglutamase n=1 Tax=Neptunicella plasticusilytica TaxID=3117012 RepID=UPI003A4E5505